MERQPQSARKSDISSYILETEIGHGASGTCFKAVNKSDGSVVAIKKISINTIKGNSLKSALKQVEVLKSLSHPNIIKYHDSFTDDNYLYIVMEYAQKGDLHTVLKRRRIKGQFYSEGQIWEMGRQLSECLKYLHSKNIVHRDFKTLNIFIGQNNNLLVGDLGVSKIIKSDAGLYSRVGTPLYLSPEIIKYEKYDYKADIWGLGCVMYIIASLNHPFEGKNIISLGQNIIFSQPKTIANVSSELNGFIKMLLEKDANKRPDSKFIISNYFTAEMVQARQNQFVYKKPSKKEISPQIVIESAKNVQAKVNNFTNGEEPKHQKKGSIQKLEYDFKQKLKSNKIIFVENRIIPQQQTIIIEALIQNQAPQQRTKQKIRDIFSAKQRTVLNKSIVADAEKIMPLLQPTQNKKMLVTPIFKSSVLSDKAQTEGQQFKYTQVRQNFVKARNIQSAKYRSTQAQSEAPVRALSQIQIDKTFIVGNVNKMYFDFNANNEREKKLVRPKSGMGRKLIPSCSEIKYVVKRISTEDASHLNTQTQTQLLKKPEVIII